MFKITHYLTYNNIFMDNTSSQSELETCNVDYKVYKLK